MGRYLPGDWKLLAGILEMEAGRCYRTLPVPRTPPPDLPACEATGSVLVRDFPNRKLPVPRGHRFTGKPHHQTSFISSFNYTLKFPTSETPDNWAFYYWLNPINSLLYCRISIPYKGNALNSCYSWFIVNNKH